jgi:hypothetical protein
MKWINRTRAIILMLLPALGWAQEYTITLVAGGGLNVADGVPATQDQVAPGGIAVDAAGNQYFPEVFSTANYVSKVAPDGIITTIAGSIDNPNGFAGDGSPATNAEFISLSPPVQRWIPKATSTSRMDSTTGSEKCPRMA